MSQIAAGSFIQLLRTDRTVVAVYVTTAITMTGQGIISPVLPLLMVSLPNHMSGGMASRLKCGATLLRRTDVLY